MDAYFNRDDFERMLKEKADEFSMYPNKRIWNSLYNNLHPGKRWPSIAMCILIITSLMGVGYLNTDNVPQQAALASAKKSSEMPVAKSTSGYHKQQSVQQTLNNIIYSDQAAAVTETTVRNDAEKITSKDVKANDPLYPAAYTTVSVQPAIQITGSTPAENIRHKVKATDDENGQLSANENTAPIVNPDKNSISNEIVIAPITPSALTTIAANTNKKSDKLQEATNDQSEASKLLEKAWIESYAFEHKPAARSWANRVKWQFYAAPSIVQRTLSVNAKIPAASLSSAFLQNGMISGNYDQQDINQQVKQRPSIGLEAGAAVQYSLFRNIKVKTGIQLNYTRYNALAFENSHPIGTTITLTDDNTHQPYEVYRTTSFTNKTGLSPVKLHNETYQVSIPLGLELKLAGKEKLQWGVGATIQPTFIFAGRNFLISSDRGSYVKDNSLLNRWNLNAGLETFISYKKGDYTWQVGPQIRRQLFTTNSLSYSVEERLYNYGIKLGVSKLLK